MKQRSSRHTSLNRRGFLAGVAGTAVVAGLNRSAAFALTVDSDSALNLAKVAIPSSLTMLSENKIGSLNDGFAPTSSRDRKNGSYSIHRGLEGDTRAQWVQYDWKQPISTHQVALFWWDYTKHAALPGVYHLEHRAAEGANRLIRSCNAERFAKVGAGASRQDANRGFAVDRSPFAVKIAVHHFAQCAVAADGNDARSAAG